MTRLDETLQAIEEFTEQQDEARDADADFDGGEWSGPAHDKLFNEGITKIVLERYDNLQAFRDEAGEEMTYELGIMALLA
jgi:hypothetical protein